MDVRGGSRQVKLMGSKSSLPRALVERRGGLSVFGQIGDAGGNG